MKKFALFIVLVSFLGCSMKVKTEGTEDVSVNLKVMSYNIHHANPPSKSGLIDMDAIAQIILKEKPDLVGLQEVDRFTKRSGGIDQAQVLAEKTGMHFQFFKAINYDGGEYGLAILSRFPIKEHSLMALPQVFKDEERVLSWVQVSLPNRQEIVFANTHLDAQKLDRNRVVQMQSILAKLKPIKLPTILMGDLNSEPHQEPVRVLDTEFTRSCANQCAFTFPQDVPTKTIDYIATRNTKWNLVSHQVVAEQYASDHRPVVAVYQIK